MRLIKSDGSETSIYAAARSNITEKVTFYKAAEGLWYAAVQTFAPPELRAQGTSIIEVAYAFDGSERGDAAVIKWAEATFNRAKHPEQESDGE